MMTRRDSALVLALVASLALVVLVGAPAFRLAATPAPSDPPVVAVDRPYRGRARPPRVDQPADGAYASRPTRCTAVRRARPERPRWQRGRISPHAGRPTRRAGPTFELREDVLARRPAGHRGRRLLHDPRPTGPRLRRPTLDLMGRGDGPCGRRADVRFTLDTPIGGFLQAATQPIAPAHLLADVPVTSCWTIPWRAAGRLGSVRAGQPRGRSRRAATIRGAQRRHTDGRSIRRSYRLSLATIAPTSRPELPRPYLDGIEFHYYEDGDALAADYAAGFLDAISGVDLAVPPTSPSSRQKPLLRYPGSTPSSRSCSTCALDIRPSRRPPPASGCYGRSIARRSSTMRTAVRVSAPTRSSRRARPCSRGVAGHPV